jgi:hypothetical protein
VLSLLTVFATLDVVLSSVAFDAMPSFHPQLLSGPPHLKPMHLR